MAAEAKLAQMTLEQRVNGRTLELERANEALRTSQEQYRLLTELSPDAVFVHVDGKIVFANPTMVELMEAASEDQLIGIDALDVMHPDFHEHIKRTRADISRTDKRTEFQDLRYKTLRGNTVDVDASASTTTWAGQKAFLVVARDITDRKRMERQLIQSQKLEAVGQLTGGVAHDFNNLLAVIQGNAELLADDVGRDNKLARAIVRAAERGTELTQRLLVFSRRQTLQPKSVDLKTLFAGLHDLLDRTLGETIEVEMLAEDGLWHAMADPGQLESGLLNLAISARDAMPKGGKLTIECRNATLDESDTSKNADAAAGQYVVVAVSDSGIGMSREVRTRVFEPFFTTKDVGKGSGLGLSMIYGFAKESGGHVTVESEPNVGTTVKVYLPRGEGASSTRAVPATPTLPHGLGELVLVIEDDSDVRALAVRMLEGLGYRVDAVSAAASALDMLAQESYDVVLSDVVLPGGMSGPKFAEVARASDPNIKIVFMSGYPADTVRLDEFMGSDWVILKKPFRRSDLASAIRNVVDPHATQRVSAAGG